MKVAINVSWMTPGKAGGMEWYVRALIDELGAIDQRNQYLVITSPLNDHTFPALPPGWERLVYKGDENNPVSYRLLPSPNYEHQPPHLDQMLRAAGVSLLFCPLMYGLPILHDIPTVVTIPDLQHEALPELFDDYELGSRALGFPDSLRRATAVLGISEHVASEIVRSYDISPDRVVATPLGLSPDFETDSALVATYEVSARARYRIEGDYLFFPGNAWPHKNHEKLLEAFEKASETRDNLRLVFTGENAVASLIPARLRNKVDHLGYVSREEIIGLMAGATALIFPSRFEGFGLPLLEAMAVSTPILCSDIPTLREIGAGVPIYFDPERSDSIASAIEDFFASADEAERQRAGMGDRLNLFRYRSTAEQTLAVIEDIAHGRRTPPEPVRRGSRPLSGRSDLMDGFARWWIKAPELKSLEMEAVAVSNHPDGRSRPVSVVAVSVDGVVIGEIRLEAGGSSRRLEAVIPDWLASRELRELEIHDVSEGSVDSESEIRIVHLVAEDGGLGRVRLI